MAVLPDRLFWKNIPRGNREDLHLQVCWGKGLGLLAWWSRARTSLQFAAWKEDRGDGDSGCPSVVRGHGLPGKVRGLR